MADSGSSPVRAPLLSLVIPTLNEAPNLPHLLRRVARSLRGVPYEVIVADDASTDGTADLTEALSGRFPVRVLRRNRDFGLAAAVLEGFQAARGELLAVMDADLQHDPGILPRLVDALATHEVAIGSRYAFQGKTCGWSFARELESRVAAWLTRKVLGLSVRDPLSGFFAIRRTTLEAIHAPERPQGWKILLELLAHAPGVAVAEVPFTFRSRKRGRTKMNPWVAGVWLRRLFELRSLSRVGHRDLEVVPS